MDFKLAVTGSLPDEIDVDLDVVKEAMSDVLYAALVGLGRGIEPAALYIQFGAGQKVNIINAPVCVPSVPVLEEIPDVELPGMWERADFEGGQDEVRPRERRAGRWED